MTPRVEWHTPFPPLPGYCDHVDIKHDGTTLWAVADVNPTLQIYKWIPETLTWRLVFDMLRDITISPHIKLGLGHSVEVGPYNVHIVYLYKNQTTNETGIMHLGIAKNTLL